MAAIIRSGQSWAVGAAEPAHPYERTVPKIAAVPESDHQTDDHLQPHQPAAHRAQDGGEHAKVPMMFIMTGEPATR